jgi:hypothetical protein|tara:strand:- start:834 stop:1154 length:321 start_codon:yes stop_codon:yes gene_type:complete
VFEEVTAKHQIKGVVVKWPMDVSTLFEQGDSGVKMVADIGVQVDTEAICGTYMIDEPTPPATKIEYIINIRHVTVEPSIHKYTPDSLACKVARPKATPILISQRFT